jgi:hypothetical protein
MKPKNSASIFDGVIEDITPSEFMCGIGQCPSVFRKEDGNLLIIGAMVNRSLFSNKITNRIGDHEEIIEVPYDLLKGLGA